MDGYNEKNLIIVSYICLLQSSKALIASANKLCLILYSSHTEMDLLADMQKRNIINEIKMLK